MSGMSQGARQLAAFGFAALVLGLAGAGGRWWLGESWATVITMCCLEALIISAVIGTRRVMRKR
jgi:sigma54-dependent transcription regulator